MEERVEIPVVNNTENKKELINRVEKTVLSILHQICQRELPKLSYSTQKSDIWTNQIGLMDTNDPEVDDDGVDDEDVDNRSINSTISLFSQQNQLKQQQQESSTNTKNNSIELNANNNTIHTVIDFANKRGRIKMTQMIIVLAQAHKHLISKQIQTKRSFYYELKGSNASHLFERQTIVDKNIYQVANLLQCTTWDLGFVATSKGMVAGNLTLKFECGDETNCNTPGGVSIPQIATNTAGQIIEINYTARCILVVEKESIFQKLLDESCTHRLQVILITGKGYPDTATRIFIKMLADKISLPIYILVDANPHGFEIMCVYKYGSMNLSWGKSNMTCPTIRWIGFYPSELIGLHLPRLSLTNDDKMKLRSLEKRLYLNDVERNELKLMQLGKAEIESVAGISAKFLTSRYLSMKIQE